ncbi:hypothetical protein WJX72_010612 [[Myrmecia] bisecta]|uniref:ABC transporter domain-containing protein n=1 Tax=[Myrmecia] bisecta TaxID=41462 RepID=A0AAW1R9N1_9CHLO
MAVSLFRLMGALGRTLVIATTIATLVLLVIMVLGGFVIIKPDIHPWWIWGFWASPLMYAQQAAANNEFTSPKWRFPAPLNPSETMGEYALFARGLFYRYYWVWIGISVVWAYCLLFNAALVIAQTYLHPLGGSTHGAPPTESDVLTADTKRGVAGTHDPAHPQGQPNGVPAPANWKEGRSESSRGSSNAVISAAEQGLQDNHAGLERDSRTAIKGVSREGDLVLPFPKLAMTFAHIWYSVDLPKGATPAPPNPAVPENVQIVGGKVQLVLLKDVSGAFQPGVLTALVGVSGAGKTTLMDVLAGRKTEGHITGDIRVGGYPKDQKTFARISGYVEQNDIHSPQLTVYESLMFSARLRLHGVDMLTAERFVHQIMDLVELTPLSSALVGLPGVTGLSVEQRKRLTIAVELVANPSIIFMDEPTTGLDARAAAIVMRTVRNTVNTGRTVVCTIHQPSIDIFEAFDALLLLKRGGKCIYSGPLGHHSCRLIEYFESIPGVPKIRPGINPATWMLEVTSPAMEDKLGVDFADVYSRSPLYREVEALIQQLSQPQGEALHFDSPYATNFATQTLLLLRRSFVIYWRSPQYNTVRYTYTVAVGFIIGSIYWRLGMRRSTYGDILNVMGGLFSSTIFLGVSNASSVQPVVAVERAVFYRERAAGMYGAFPYGFAQGAVEIPFLLIQTIVYTAITYFMIHFEYNAAKFFWYLFFVFLTLLYYTLYGIAAVAVTPNVQMAAVISSAFYSLWFLFAGFVIPRPRIPGWWVWYYYLDPVAFTLYGLIASQLGDVDTLITVPGQPPQTVRHFLRTYFDFKHDFLGFGVLILLGFSAALWIGSAMALRFINFNKR